MLNDSGIEIDQEFLDNFLEESNFVVQNLKAYVSDFKEPSQNKLFEKFGQEIDRIMGAAYTLSLNDVGDLARLGKELGYKASQVQEMEKLPVVQSLLSQLANSLEKILHSMSKGIRPQSEKYSSLLTKLSTASHQLGNLRTTVG